MLYEKNMETIYPGFILKTVLLQVVLFFLPDCIYTQSFEWARGGGSTTKAGGLSSAMDRNGNIYVSGYFENTITFGTISLVSSGLSDIFIVKYDPAGNALWATKAGGTSAESGSGIALDGNDNVFITGAFIGTASFGSLTISSSGFSDIYLAKCDPNGVFLWVRRAGGSSNYEIAYTVAADPAGNTYITGFVKSSTNQFGSYTMTTPGNGGASMFIAKYDPNGTCLWLRDMSPTNNNGVHEGKEIVFDPVGNKIYVTGYYQNTATFGGFILPASPGNCVFVAQYNETGSCIWVRQSAPSSTTATFGNAITTDNQGNIIVCGHYYQGTSLDGIILAGFGGLASDIFVAKYNSAGSILWAQNAGGGSQDQAKDVITVQGNYIYMAGHFGGPASFGSFTLTGAGGAESFVAKYDASGNLLFVLSPSGTSTEYTYTVTADAVKDEAYISGYFNSNPAFFGSSSLTNAGTEDFFLAKISNQTATPVDWISFRASAVSRNEVLLTWTTASGENNDRFEIERKVNGKSFEKIGSIPGLNPDGGIQEYSFTDSEASGYILCYRLKRNKSDGTFDYSPVAEVIIPAAEALIDAEIFPNPLNGDALTLTVSDPEGGKLNLFITDVSGKQILSEKMALETGISRAEINTKNLSRGVYFVKIEKGGNKIIRKFIKN